MKNKIGYKNSNGFLRLCQDVPIKFLFLLDIFMIRLLDISFRLYATFFSKQCVPISFKQIHIDEF